ncbi:hypothetical protein BKA58DRAFT_461671 [Alternaria rosae]|uniref:uncharacterized protein n=1 Tax=Alternaria rosae TaxID=1187941 RepID=UPI001E8DFA45|nr:uncharacterized protein BKA58DRAFT_461671 [Alternaria rosae]KAH6865714.1 hypothetical protein BKA58DRAFT_461671 [Alternaria rosae]
MTNTTEMKAKDVQFFLGAFERDLRAESDSTLQHHACAFLRRRLRYLSSEIYKHFNVEEITASDAYSPDGKSVTGSLQQLQPIDTDEPDPTLMPAFSIIREFLFDGTAYEALKENVKNFTQHTRNYGEEMVDIMVRNVHPPSKHLGSPPNVDATRLFNLFNIFLADLAKEAEIHMISASDRAGIKSVHEKLSKLAARLNALWTDQVPSWHFYPLIPTNNGCRSFMSPSANAIFRLYHHQLVDIHEINDIPPEDQNHEYEYSPMPADNVPPIGPNLLMHFFLHPEESPSSAVLLPSIPKRKDNILEPCPVRGSSIGWGLDVVTGVDELKLFGLALLGTLASIIFGLVWSVIKHDIQGAFAVAGFLFAILTFTIASVKALDF